jgi:hypothetical protein
MNCARSPAMTIRELLAVEDTAVLLEFRCDETRVLLWPGIRNQFFRFIIGDLVLGKTLVELRPGANLRANFCGAIRCIVNTAVHNLRHRHALRGTTLVTTAGAGLLRRDGRWFNRLSDHFVAALPAQTVVLEEPFKWEWRMPRHNQRLLFGTPALLSQFAVGRLRLRSRHWEQARRLVGLMEGRAERELGWKMGSRRREFLVRRLAEHGAAAAHSSIGYQRLFARLGIRLVLKEMGCYGQSSVFNAAARDMGLVTAEYQHGMVSGGHDVYNVAPTLAQSTDYRHTLPEFFLSYGRWWSDQINVPTKQIVVGNPHRYEKLAGANASRGKQRDILVLGDSAQSDMFFELSRQLTQRLPSGTRIVFRPHQIVRSRYGPTNELSGVHLDRQSDIYESFSRARAVVSEVSTGLFEAIGLVERIFVLESPRSRFVLPEHPFSSFLDADDLAEQLQKDGTGSEIRVDAEQIWASGWHARYLEFVANVLTGSTY